MKMKKEHFDMLKSDIEAVKRKHPSAETLYREGKFPRAEQTKDVNKRFRWDLFWAVHRYYRELFDYLNDDHIDTALRKIVPDIV